MEELTGSQQRDLTAFLQLVGYRVQGERPGPRDEVSNQKLFTTAYFLVSALAGMETQKGAGWCLPGPGNAVAFYLLLDRAAVMTEEGWDSSLLFSPGVKMWRLIKNPVTLPASTLRVCQSYSGRTTFWSSHCKSLSKYSQ